MQILIRTYLWIGIWAILCICAGQALAQSCHFNLKFKLANGETVCLNTQKFANETPRKQQSSIERLARNANNYYLAKSVDERCQSWGFVDVASMVQQISDKISPPRTAFDNAKKVALSECESSGCKCQILIDDGIANSAHPEYAKIFDRGIPSQTTQIATGPERNQKPNDIGSSAQIAQPTNPSLLGVLSAIGQAVQSPADPKPSSLADEQRIAAEVKVRLDAILAAEAKERERQRLEAEAKAREDQRLASEAKTREEQRLASEAKQREIQRVAAEARAREEQRIAAEAKAREELRLAAESKAREDQRLAAEAKQREVLQLAAAAKAREEIRLAAEAKARDEQRAAAEAKAREELRLAAEVKAREEAEERLRFAQQLANASSAQNGKRVALTIGNSGYKKEPLINPVNDARDMAAALRAVGFETQELLDATKLQMIQATRIFENKVRNSDVALIYYAGHGVEIRGKNYLIPVGANLEKEYEVPDQGYDAAQWLDMLEYAKGTNDKRVNIVILDACRNNSFKRESRSTNAGLARMDAPVGTFLAYSTAPGKVALDGNGRDRNSPFAKHLVNTIKLPNLPIEQVFKRVRSAVIEETKGNQIPWDSSSLVGDFFFTVKK